MWVHVGLKTWADVRPMVDFAQAMGAQEVRDCEKPPPIPERRDSLLRVVIADRYEIQERIGSGGMGSVYRAKQRGLGREVAVKVLKRELNRDPSIFTRFEREAKAMSRLCHPNTVRVFDFGQTSDKRLYLVMELLEGELLSASLLHQHAQGVGRALRITRQILASLAEAHSNGIVHRDLKPDNIFLASIQGESEPVVKVLDFGIAKIVHDDNQFDHLETTAGAVFGTPRFMSPEQAQGKPLDGRSDLYTVGLLLYQMLTGEAPFMDTDAVVVMARHIRDDPQRPSERLPEGRISRKVEELTMKALAKRPEDRFQSAAEFIEAIEKAMPDVITARYRRSSAPPPAPAKRRTGPMVAALLLGLAAIASYLALRPSRQLDIDQASQKDQVGTAKRTENLHETAPRHVDNEQADTDKANAQMGRAMLDSTPEGAAVWRAGRRIGMTPMEVRWSSSEEAVVELRKKGFGALTVDLETVGEDFVAALAPQTEKVARKKRPRRRLRDSPASSATRPDPYEKF